MKFILIKPTAEEVGCGSRQNRMEDILSGLVTGTELLCERVIETAAELKQAADSGELQGKRIFLAVSLDDSGMNLEASRMMAVFRRNAKMLAEEWCRVPSVLGCLEGSAACVWVDGTTELYTKALCRDLIFAMNSCGCLFPGRPAVEATGSLQNFAVRARNSGKRPEEEYRASVCELAERLQEVCLPSERADRSVHNPEKKKLLCIHASEYRTSNTLSLWTMVKQNLEASMEISEISLRNGEIKDCGGCPFKMCMHFSSKNSCYYGGPIPEKVYPALEECDALMILCPNYNDAVSANISAFINRLTAMYRRRPFYEKKLYAIVVSGYSGSDIVAGQLIDSLAMNKAFCLPPYFAMMETANDPGSIVKVPGIESKARIFAKRILQWTQSI